MNDSRTSSGAAAGGCTAPAWGGGPVRWGRPGFVVTKGLVLVVGGVLLFGWTVVVVGVSAIAFSRPAESEKAGRADVETEDSSEPVGGQPELVSLTQRRLETERARTDGLSLDLAGAHQEIADLRRKLAAANQQMAELNRKLSESPPRSAPRPPPRPPGPGETQHQAEDRREADDHEPPRPPPSALTPLTVVTLPEYVDPLRGPRASERQLAEGLTGRASVRLRLPVPADPTRRRAMGRDDRFTFIEEEGQLVVATRGRSARAGSARALMRVASTRIREGALWWEWHRPPVAVVGERGFRDQLSELEDRLRYATLEVCDPNGAILVKVQFVEPVPFEVKLGDLRPVPHEFGGWAVALAAGSLPAGWTFDAEEDQPQGRLLHGDDIVLAVAVSTAGGPDVAMGDNTVRVRWGDASGPGADAGHDVRERASRGGVRHRSRQLESRLREVEQTAERLAAELKNRIEALGMEEFIVRLQVAVRRLKEEEQEQKAMEARLHEESPELKQVADELAAQEGLIDKGEAAPAAELAKAQRELSELRARKRRLEREPGLRVHVTRLQRAEQAVQQRRKAIERLLAPYAAVLEKSDILALSERLEEARKERGELTAQLSALKTEAERTAMLAEALADQGKPLRLQIVAAGSGAVLGMIEIVP